MSIRCLKNFQHAGSELNSVLCSISMRALRQAQLTPIDTDTVSCTNQHKNLPDLPV